MTKPKVMSKKRLIIALIIIALATPFLIKTFQIALYNWEQKERSSVVGIKEYRQSSFRERGFPTLEAKVPSNWYFEQFPLSEEELIWFALTGPLDRKNSQYTVLDFYVFKKNNKPEYQSLDAFAQHELTQSSFRDTIVLFNQKKKIAGYEGVEMKTTQKAFQFRNPYADDYQEIEQFAVLEKDNYFIKIHYSATEDFFDASFTAYAEFLKTLVIK